MGAVASARPHKFYLAMPAAWFLGDGPAAANLSSFVGRKPERPFDRILLDRARRSNLAAPAKHLIGKRLHPVRRNECGYRRNRRGRPQLGECSEAIRILKPWGVDVASGVEASPKDPEKVRAFVRAVRETEKDK